ncbi:MAG: glycosyltransferase, partial [Cyanobacteria bacterium J06648_11]
MKFLFTINPMTGHFHPMVPVAKALRDRGHEVGFATARSFGHVVTKAEFRHFPAGADHDGSKEIFLALQEKGVISKDIALGTDVYLKLFIDVLAPRIADDILDLAKTWKPDVIIREQTEFGGCVAAEKLDIPHALVSWAFHLSGPKASQMLPGKNPLARLWNKLAIAFRLARLWMRYGLPFYQFVPALEKYFVLDFMPPTWTATASTPANVSHAFFAPPFDRSGDEGLPTWLGDLSGAPLVYATLGTTFNQRADLFGLVIDAFRNQPFNLIVTVGRSMDPAQFGELPSNIKVERYIPQSLILPHCDAIIYHGGFNTLLSSLAAGLPQIVV